MDIWQNRKCWKYFNETFFNIPRRLRNSGKSKTVHTQFKRMATTVAFSFCITLNVYDGQNVSPCRYRKKLQEIVVKKSDVTTVSFMWPKSE